MKMENISPLLDELDDILGQDNGFAQTTEKYIFSTATGKLIFLKDKRFSAYSTD